MGTHCRHRLCSSRHVEITFVTLHWRTFANVGGADMKEHFVIDPLISKRQQLMLATQLCRMVLKVRYFSSFSLLITLHVYLSFLIRTQSSPYRPTHTQLPSHPCSLGWNARATRFPAPSTANHPLHRNKTQT